FLEYCSLVPEHCFRDVWLDSPPIRRHTISPNQLGRTPPHGMPKTESEISTRVSSMNLATPRRIVFWHSTTKASKLSGRSNWAAYLARYCCMYVSTRLSASR